MTAAAAAGEVTRLEVTPGPDTPYTPTCDAAPAGAEAPLVFEGSGPQAFTFGPGRVQCQLRVDGDGSVRVEATGARGNRTSLATSGGGSTLRFTIE